MQTLLVLERFGFHARFCFSTSVSLTPYRLFYLEKPGPFPHGGIFDGPSLSRIAGVRNSCLGLQKQ